MATSFFICYDFPFIFKLLNPYKNYVPLIAPYPETYSNILQMSVTFFLQFQ